ncbi:MAG TPA: hypothetical protein VGO87_07275 [Acidimicrobiia bacterium]
MNSSWLRPATETPVDDHRRPPAGGVAITRVVNLAPDWAELALQGALPRRPALRLSSRVVADDRSGPCRRLQGTLVSRRGWFRLPVELQLAGWSASATELTLRPRRSGRRPGWARWYLSAGTAVMDRLAAGDPGRRDLSPDTAARPGVGVGAGQ